MAEAKRGETVIKVTTIVENHSNPAPGIPGEHGLSLKVEYKGRERLFDTGQTGIFLDNADKMNIDLSEIDDIILSHGHYDHTGGLPAYLKRYRGKTIYVGRNFFDKKYRKDSDGVMVYNGNPSLAVIEESGSVICVINERIRKLDEGIWLVRDFKMKHDFETWNDCFYIGNHSEKDL